MNDQFTHCSLGVVIIMLQSPLAKFSLTTFELCYLTLLTVLTKYWREFVEARLLRAGGSWRVNDSVGVSAPKTESCETLRPAL